MLCFSSYSPETLVPDVDVKQVIDRIIDAGVFRAKRIRSDVPLIYDYYGDHYLGAAHGLAGILQMLIRCLSKVINKIMQAEYVHQNTQ